MSTTPATATATAMMAGVAVPEMYAREAMISWLRGEFAAANAIIDALCAHIAEITGGGEENAAVFAAIHRRRANWIPVLQMQKYFSIGEVTFHLTAAAEKARKADEVVAATDEPAAKWEEEDSSSVDAVNGSCGGSGGGGGGDGDGSGGSSIHEEQQSSVENVETEPSTGEVQICVDHEGCTARPERIKTCKGFTAKEPVKGHMMNVVKGLKMFEDIFMESELAKLADYINELRAAGRNGELAGETFIFFNKQLKGNKREIIQLGVPIFQSTNEETASTIEPIPAILQNVIDHLVQWRLIPESRKPNSCFINFFDEGDFSQPYFKPPHLDNPISTLFLYETTMAFGRVLAGDHEGNYKGSLTLPVKEGSLIVMRGNSADMARHVVCPSPNSRVCITFLKVRAPRTTAGVESPQSLSPPLTITTTTSLPGMALWSPDSPTGYVASHPHAWGMAALQPTPLLMLPRPTSCASPTRKQSGRNNGTGVFLPWTVGPKKYIKHLPPRIQKRRLHSLALPPPLKMQVEKASQIPCIAV